MIDIHSHILFGVDDGAKDLEESILMLKEAKKIGFDKIIATPHVMRAKYDKQKTKEAFDTLLPYAKEIGIDLYQGYEYNCYALNDDGIDRAIEFCTEGTKTILLEFKSTVGFPANWEGIVSSFQRKGVKIIIAHPERYRQVQNDLKKIERSVFIGCDLQIDALSLCEKGLFNPTRRCAKKLLDSTNVSWIASDAHCVEDYVQFGEIYKTFDNETYFSSNRNDDYFVFELKNSNKKD